MFLHKTQTKVVGTVGGLLGGLILLSLAGSANAAFISSNFVDNNDSTTGVVSGLDFSMGKKVGQTHNAVLSQITSGSLSVWSGTTLSQSDALLNNVSDIKPLLTANYYILNPETGQLTTGPLTIISGPLSTGITLSSAENGILHDSTSVPEPSSLLLMGIGLAALGFVRRRK